MQPTELVLLTVIGLMFLAIGVMIKRIRDQDAELKAAKIAEAAGCGALR